MFNNTNAIQTEKPAMLANTMKQYITHKPSILGLIETRQHYETWQHHSKETRKHERDSSLATAEKHTHPTTSANQAESPNLP
jgi:hypothetical protein